MLSTFYCEWNIGMWFESLLAFILFKFKKRPNISGLYTLITFIPWTVLHLMCNTVHGINYNYIYYIYCTVLPEDGLPQLSVFLPLKLFLPQRKKDKNKTKTHTKTIIHCLFPYSYCVWSIPWMPIISICRWAMPLTMDSARDIIPSTDTVYLLR